MSGSPRGRTISANLPKILKALYIKGYKTGNALTVYAISEASTVRRETVDEMLRVARIMQLVEIVKVTDAKRPGCKSKLYRLTEQGIYMAALHNPKLKCPTKIRDHALMLSANSRKRNFQEFQLILALAEAIVKKGSAAPNSYLRIEIAADKNGRVGWGVKENLKQEVVETTI